MSFESLSLFVSSPTRLWPTTTIQPNGWSSESTIGSRAELTSGERSPVTSCSSVIDISSESSSESRQSPRRDYLRRRSSFAGLGNVRRSEDRVEDCGLLPNRNSISTSQLSSGSTHLGGNEIRPLYPNCDATVWLRSCRQEINEPIEGNQSGCIPAWINGSLLRNGPGSLVVGNMQFNHLFDSSALLHRFGIRDGKVTYQSRFIQTDTFKRNRAANRIVVTEFGTSSVPDPCHTIFQRMASIFQPGEFSDNAMISIYPFGDEYFAFTEYPVIHSINIETLETQRKVNVGHHLGIVSHTSHPHILADGTVFNLGMTVTKTGPQYNIICFPSGRAMFDDAHVVATIPSRWKLYPGYMHTFGITQSYFVIVEQPLSVSVPEMIRSQIQSRPLAGNLKWFDDHPTCIYLIRRSTGQLVRTFEADAFFYLHIINAYETSSEDFVVLDICCYRDPSMLNCMYIEAMKSMQYNPDYARMFRAKPLRFVLPLREATIEKKNQPKSLLRSLSISNVLNRIGGRIQPKLRRSASETQGFAACRHSSIECLYEEEARIHHGMRAAADNLVDLRASKAESFAMPNSKHVFCKPELLCDLGCETPRIFYDKHMGKDYRYFYAISSDVDSDNPGTIIKVDVVNKTYKTWCEANCYPSEPIFIPNPNNVDEDDGVVLASLVWSAVDECRAGLLVLCAKTWTELGRAEFQTPSPVPKCLHGWFAAAKI